MNVRDMAEKIIKEAQKPLSPVEIWEIAEPQGYGEKLKLKGRTIPRTIGARLYTDIKDNQNSKFVKIQTKPTRFYLKDLPQTYNINLSDSHSIQKSVQKVKSYSERDLHQLLSYYVYTYYSIYTKTIFHENSKKKRLHNGNTRIL